MIRVRGLGKRYGERVALADVDLDFAPGTFTAVVGANGSGKSTLLRCIAGLVGHEGTVEREARAVAFLPQSPALPAHATAGELVRLFRRIAGGGRDAALPVAPDRTLGTLSGGEQQRVALAALLAMDARVLLLDEPTADLDAAARAALLVELASRRDAGATVVVTTPAPQMGELARVADRVLVLASGRVTAAAPMSLGAVSSVSVEAAS